MLSRRFQIVVRYEEVLIVETLRTQDENQQVWSSMYDTHCPLEVGPASMRPRVCVPIGGSETSVLGAAGVSAENQQRRIITQGEPSEARYFT